MECDVEENGKEEECFFHKLCVISRRWRRRKGDNADMNKHLRKSAIICVICGINLRYLFLYFRKVFTCLFGKRESFVLLCETIGSSDILAQQPSFRRNLFHKAYPNFC
jgi:hypothetical protein